MVGKIIRGVGGFYYVHLPGDNIYECKARGAFRKDKIKPMVGDDCEIDIISEEDKTGNIISILKRHNSLIRPAVSNIDQAIIIFALSNPKPNYNLLDRFLITMSVQDIDTIICFNKSDLIDEAAAQEIKTIYEGCGCEVLLVSTYDGSNIDVLRSRLCGKTTALAGPSGVGKSSVVNAVNPSTDAKTGELSEKIQRGKHTTRHVELISIDDDTFILDTPGFSSLYIEDMEAEDLRHHYNEFREYEGSCRFNGCVHINEPDCAVKEAVAGGDISKLRYENYKLLYEELKEKRRW